MRRSWLALAPLAALAWLACNDAYETEPETPVPPTAEAGPPSAGERGGSCYPNATCNATLTCIDSLCVLLGVEGGAIVPDGGEEVDANRPVLPCPVPDVAQLAGEVQCGKDGVTCTNACCLSAGHLQCAPAGDAVKCADGRFLCDSANDCGSTKCCATLTKRNTPSCPSLQLRESGCKSICELGDALVCVTDDECGGSRKCVPTQVAHGPGSTITLRLCQDPTAPK